MSATKSDCSSGSTASAEGAEATTSAEVSPEMIPAAIPVNISSPSPSKTISQEFQEFEGTTIFAPSPSPTYRCTTELDTQDYVDSTNVIPDATASDYVEVCTENDCGNYHVDS
ncbi:ATPase family AAA domain-containing protein 3 [Phytophthora nicotianae]|uniref:ATPase family AAA domain-containing protein 3 n=1 Tax=Phytophthora nicotianae TaxID=4792 RepID=A0A0W8CKY0_PHYNI|nr:ATPase family AAA domain-containing protein 3 [Phytophthora nicotianae]